MKSLSLFVLVVVSAGTLALSGCSGCGSENTNTPAAPAVTCGRGTVAQGNQCVGEVRN